MDYAAKAAIADRMIRAYGAAGTLTATTTAYDPATGATAGTQAAQPVQMVVLDYPQKFIDGSLILTGDKQAYISAVGIASPKPGNRIQWGDVSYAVVTVKPLAPALLAVLYEAQLRI